MAFDHSGALAAGYTEDEIAAYLASRPTGGSSTRAPGFRDTMRDFGEKTALGGAGGAGMGYDTPGWDTLSHEQRQAQSQSDLNVAGMAVGGEVIGAPIGAAAGRVIGAGVGAAKRAWQATPEPVRAAAVELGKSAGKMLLHKTPIVGTAIRGAEMLSNGRKLLGALRGAGRGAGELTAEATGSAESRAATAAERVAKPRAARARAAKAPKPEATPKPGSVASRVRPSQAMRGASGPELERRAAARGRAIGRKPSMGPVPEAAPTPAPPPAPEPLATRVVPEPGNSRAPRTAGNISYGRPKGMFPVNEAAPGAAPAAAPKSVRGSQAMRGASGPELERRAAHRATAVARKLPAKIAKKVPKQSLEELLLQSLHLETEMEGLGFHPAERVILRAAIRKGGMP